MAKNILTQQVIVFFNGEGFRIVRDEYFSAWVTFLRKDVNVPRSKVALLITSLALELQVVTKEVYTQPAFRVRRVLGVRNHQFEVSVNIVHVPGREELCPSSTIDPRKHGLADHIVPMLSSFADSHFDQVSKKAVSDMS